MSSSTLQRAKKKQSDSKLKLRRAQLSEMPIIAGFIRSSSSWYEKFVSPEDMDQHNVDQKWIEDNYFRREFYIGNNGDEDVGVITMQHMDGYAYLGYIYLDVEQVGKGYGHKLMNFALKESQDRNLKGMVLIAHPEAKWAVKAYRKFGFEKIADTNEEVCKWNKGALNDYHEDGFQLYRYKLA